MTVLVTGCRGQLGTELCRQWGDQAVGVDLPDFDLTDAQSVRAAIEAIRPRIVVSAGAYTMVDRAETEASLCRAVNVEGVSHLVRACREVDATLIHISTDYVFGGNPARQIPYRESDEPDPRGVYAQSKLESERVAAQWEKHLIVRTCGLYGRVGQRSSGNFVDAILRAARAGKPLRVVCDQRCSPTYTPHLVRALRHLAAIEARGLYHVTNSGDATWHEFAVDALHQAGLQVRVDPITSSQWGAAAARPAYSVLDCSKYHALPGVPPMPPWSKALAEYLRNP